MRTTSLGLRNVEIFKLLKKNDPRALSERQLKGRSNGERRQAKRMSSRVKLRPNGSEGPMDHLIHPVSFTPSQRGTREPRPRTPCCGGAA